MLAKKLKSTKAFVICAGLLATVCVLSLAVFSRLYAQTTGPVLVIPQAIPATVGQAVTVPIQFHTGGKAVGSLVFSIDFDETCLAFDDKDDNQDGKPDQLHVTLPPMFRHTIAYDANDLDGELDFVIADYALPIASLPDTDALVRMTFDLLCQPTAGNVVTATVAFSQAPMGSFGDLTGNDLIGVMQDGSALVSAEPLPTPSATPTPIAATPTATLLSTQSPTMVLTAAPTQATPMPSTVTPSPRLYLPVVTR